MAEQSGTKPCTGTGFFLPRNFQSNQRKTRSNNRKGRSAGCGNQNNQNCQTQQVPAIQQLQLGQQQPSSAALCTAGLSPFYDPVDLQQLPMPGPICGGTGTPSVNSSFTSSSGSPFAQFSAADSFVLNPCTSRDNSFTACGLTSQGAFVSGASLSCGMAPQQLSCGTTGCVGAVSNSTVDQDLLLLQQQEAEVGAAISDLLNLRQQLTAMRQPALMPVAPAPAPINLAPALPVSLATAALGQQQQQACAGAFVGTAQYQLASLQAQQQHLCATEEQLQAELAAQVVRLLGLY